MNYRLVSIDESPEYLVHHGIKGMKWGVRRFQNEDGSLTSKGKTRYRAESVGEVVDRVKGDYESLHNRGISVRKYSRVMGTKTYRRQNQLAAKTLINQYGHKTIRSLNKDYRSKESGMTRAERDIQRDALDARNRKIAGVVAGSAFMGLSYVALMELLG